MSNHTHVELVGTGFLALFAALLYYAARSPSSEQIRRLALANVSTYLAFAALTRLLVISGTMDHEIGVVVIGLTAGVFVFPLFESLIVTPIIIRRTAHEHRGIDDSSVTPTEEK